MYAYNSFTKLKSYYIFVDIPSFVHLLSFLKLFLRLTILCGYLLLCVNIEKDLLAKHHRPSSSVTLCPWCHRMPFLCGLLHSRGDRRNFTSWFSYPVLSVRSMSKVLLILHSLNVHVSLSLWANPPLRNFTVTDDP